MFDVLDTDSNNAHLASAKLDGEAMSYVLIFGQPVFAPLSEYPLDVVPIPGVACGPNYFWLEKALTCCKNTLVLLILMQRLPAIGEKKFKPPLI